MSLVVRLPSLTRVVMVDATANVARAPWQIIRRVKLMRVPEEINVEGRYRVRYYVEADQIHEFGVALLRIKEHRLWGRIVGVYGSDFASEAYLALHGFHQVKAEGGRLFEF